MGKRKQFSSEDEYYTEEEVLSSEDDDEEKHENTIDENNKILDNMAEEFFQVDYYLKGINFVFIRYTLQDLIENINYYTIDDKGLYNPYYDKDFPRSKKDWYTETFNNYYELARCALPIILEEQGRNTMSEKQKMCICSRFAYQGIAHTEKNFVPKWISRPR